MKAETDQTLSLFSKVRVQKLTYMHIKVKSTDRSGSQQGSYMVEDSFQCVCKCKCGVFSVYANSLYCINKIKYIIHSLTEFTSKHDLS